VNALQAPPTAFLSYSWDDEPHKQWVRDLATRLRSDGVDVTLDQWQLQPGDRLPAFMETAIREHDFVIIVCTPHYKERSDARMGGVGYEGDIMTGELLSQHNERKFIPVLRCGDATEAVPTWLTGKYHVDLRETTDAERSYRDLLTTLLGQRQAPPSLGKPPTTGASGLMTPSARGGDSTVHDDEPIRILGVIVDEVSEPRLDGTRGSGLYRVPLRLSRTPSAEWAEHFERTWDHPSRYTSMHRPGILSVDGDRIVLDGTTMDEVARYHRDTLVLVLEQVNREITQREAARRSRQEMERKRIEEHRRSVEDAAERLRFDE
jgi:TIR domain